MFHLSSRARPRATSAVAILLAVTALVMPMASPAAADSPWQILPFPAGGITLSVADGFCLPLHMDALDARERAIVIGSRQGQTRFTLVTGPLKVRLTNTDNHKSLDLNISGPGRYSTDTPQVLTTYGNWLNFVPVSGTPPQLPPGAPSSVYLFSGDSRMTLDSNGIATNIDYIHGHVVDLCQQLA